ncbi:unnamed protein product [Cunninghamella echinulata]
MQPTSSDNIHGGFRRTQSQQSLPTIQFTSLKQSNYKKKKKNVKASPFSSTPSTSTSSSTTTPSKSMNQDTSTISNNNSIFVKNKNKEINAPLRAVSSSMTNLKTFSTPKPTMIMMCAKPIQQSLYVVVSDNEGELLKNDRNNYLSQDINTNNLSTSNRISSLRYLQNYSSNAITHDDKKIIKENQQQRTSHFLYNDIDYPSPVLSPSTPSSSSSFHYNNYNSSSSSFTSNPIQELMNEYQTIQQYYDPMTESLLRCLNKASTSPLPSSPLAKKKQNNLSTSLSTSSSATTFTSNSSNISSSSTTSNQSHHAPIAPISSLSLHPASCMKLNYQEQQQHHHHQHHHQHNYIPSSSDIKDSLVDTLHHHHHQPHHPHSYQRQYIHKCHIKKQLFDQQQHHYNHHPIVNTDEYLYSFSNSSNSYNSYWMSTLWSRVKNGIIKHHH